MPFITTMRSQHGAIGSYKVNLPFLNLTAGTKQQVVDIQFIL